MGIYSLKKSENPIVRRALIECEFANFDKALSIIEQGLNNQPEDAALYVVKLMAEKKLVDERQLQFAALVDFQPLGENDTFLHALRFADRELRQLLTFYQTTDEELDKWVVLDEYISVGGSPTLPNTLTIMSKYILSRRELGGYESPPELQRDDEKYDTTKGGYITWGNHPMRAWLNSGYIKHLPRYISHRLISNRIVTSGCRVPVGEDIPQDVSFDKVTLLSSSEALNLPYDIRLARFDEDDPYYGGWWLRDSTVFRVYERPYGWPYDVPYIPRDQDMTYVYGMWTISDGQWGSAYGARLGELYHDCYDIEATRPVMTVMTDIDLSDPAVADMFPMLELHSIEEIRQGVRDHIFLGGILWYVLDVQGETALLLAEQCVEKTRLDVRPWSTSKIRSWLNTAFLDMLELEKDLVVSREIATSNVEDGIVTSVEHSDDCIFLLSYEEFKKYLCKSESDKASLFDVTKERTVEELEKMRIARYKTSSSSWLLRSGEVRNKGERYLEKVVSQDDGARVWPRGMGGYKDGIIGIRPAMWIKVPS